MRPLTIPEMRWLRQQEEKARADLAGLDDALAEAALARRTMANGIPDDTVKDSPENTLTRLTL